jgi:hypothetical protein
MTTFKTFDVDIDVNSSREATWDVIFNQFTDVAKFHPLIDGSSHVGGEKGAVGVERMCQLDSKTRVVEEIIEAEEMKSMRIEIKEGGPAMIKKAFAVMEIDDAPQGGTRVTMKAEYQTSPAFLGGLVKPMMKGMFRKILIALKYHLETGQQVGKGNYKEVAKQYKSLATNEAFSSVLSSNAA